MAQLREMIWKVRGMNRDMSVSSEQKDMAWEVKNLRLMTNEGNTTMSWVNERGPGKLTLVIDKEETDGLKGWPIGEAVVNGKLVVFTTKTDGGSLEVSEQSEQSDNGQTEANDTTTTTTTTTAEPTDTDEKPDRIYVVSDIKDGKAEVKMLYEGNLGFDTKHPIETLVSVESDKVEKVYWTDGKNQPRMINILADDEKIKLWNGTDGSSVDRWFDFVSTVKKRGTLKVKKEMSGGSFQEGVIQYAYTYYNKYGQQTNILNVSPIYYISPEDRGARDDETVSNAFKITIEGVDSDFDYVRIYSIQRTAVNGTPVVRRVVDLKIEDAQEYKTGDVTYKKIEYVDTGSSGDTVNPTDLLYIGGREIVAGTMAEKDNTLFLGNLEQKNSNVSKIQEYFDGLRTGKSNNGEKVDVVMFEQDTTTKHVDLNRTYSTYAYKNRLDESQEAITTFKGGETYRFGLQIQKNTGEWSEPVWIDDVKNDKYPSTDIERDDKWNAGNIENVDLAYAMANIDMTALKKIAKDIDWDRITAVRPLVVFPDVMNRNVVCQGVVNPTVFNAKARKMGGLPFAQASWFFRPYVWKEDSESSGTSTDFAKEIRTKLLGETTQTNTVWDNAFTSIESDEDVYVLLIEATDTQMSKFLEHKGRIKTTSYGDEETENGLFWFYYDYIVPVNLVSSDTTTATTTTTTTTTAEPEAESETEAEATSEPETSSEETKKYFLLRVKGRYTSNEKQDKFPEPMRVVTSSTNDGEQMIYSTSWEYGDTNDTEVSVIGASEREYAWSSEMNVDSNTLTPYYQQDDGSSAAAKYFRWKTVANTYSYDQSTFTPTPTGTTYSYWTVEFRTVSVSEGNVDINPNGNTITFKHYEQIYNDEKKASERKLEIEGAKKVYDSVFDTAKKTDGSNTQFFVDQSVVTLNSPDMEFDTEVQSLSKSGLKMRVIGMIPLTAGASYHSITTSTSMLPLNYDEGGSKVSLTYGTGESDGMILHNNVAPYASRRLVSDYLWNDAMVRTKNGKVKTDERAADYLVYPWQRQGSMTTDTRNGGEACSVLRTKKESTMLFSQNTKYFSNTVSFENISVDMPLTENAQVMLYRLKRQSETTSEVSYYGNVEQALINTNGYKIQDKDGKTLNNSYYKNLKTYAPVSMKYLSTTHVVIALDADIDADTGDYTDNVIPLMPYGTSGTDSVGQFINPDDTAASETFWGDNVRFKQSSIDVGDKNEYDFLWLAEIYKDVENRFGGESEDALKANRWTVGGESIALDDTNRNSTITLKWTVGDTYYQRYDCLKTYPMSDEDVNQVVEILSFMVETRVNIDGRYDRNRGQIDNTVMSPKNFNLLNQVYSQKDNFFTYQKSSDEDEEKRTYPNEIYYSTTKENGADVDAYTDVTMASMLEMDGNKGEVNAIRRMGNNLIVFQDSGVAQILYNENVQVSTENGVPIEIANSGKVQGKRYVSDKIGCRNKWSIVESTGGSLYFIDQNTGDMYVMSGNGIENVSMGKGMNSWVKTTLERQEDERWNPGTWANMRGQYDRRNGDVIYQTEAEAVAYSERVGQFTSFYDYGGAAFLAGVDDKEVWVRYDAGEERTELWEHQKGLYGQMFGETKPYWITLIANEGPTVSKTMTNLSMTASVDGDTEVVDEAVKSRAAGQANSRAYAEGEEKWKADYIRPFDSVEVWNEYQHGITDLKDEKINKVEDQTALKRKYRIWHWMLPRDNADLKMDEGMEIYRAKPRPMNRIRNMWAYVKLKKEAPTARMQMHDVWMGYYV